MLAVPRGRALRRGLAILECVQERGCLVIIYSASIYQTAVMGQALLGRASFILMAALGGGDSESMTVLLCTYCVPGNAHASSTYESISQPGRARLVSPHFTDVQTEACAPGHTLNQRPTQAPSTPMPGPAWGSLFSAQ